MQPAPIVQKTRKKGGARGAPATRGVKGGGNGSGRGGGPSRVQHAKGAAKKGKKDRSNGSDDKGDEGDGGGEENVTDAGARVTRQTGRAKCMFKA